MELGVGLGATGERVGRDRRGIGKGEKGWERD